MTDARTAATTAGINPIPNSRRWNTLAPMPILDFPLVNVNRGIAAHYATMAVAQNIAYASVLRDFRNRDPQDGQDWGQRLRDVIANHFEPMHAAFTAAALLNGLDAVRVVEILTDSPETLTELLSQWLPPGVDWSDIDSAVAPLLPDTTPKDTTCAQG